MGIRRLILSSLLLFAALPAARAQEPAQDDPLGGFSVPGLPTGEIKTHAEFVSEVKAIAPGKPFTVALSLTHPPEWHSYYLNSGGVEKSAEIKWILPDGFTGGPIQWPTPEVKDGFFGKSFAYSGNPVLLAEITPPTNLTAGSSITIKADAHWQICKDMCKDEPGPDAKPFELTLPVAATAEADPAQAALFSKARASQPKSDPALKVSAEASGGSIRLRIHNEGPVAKLDLSKTPIEFIPNYSFINCFSQGGGISKEGDDWLISLQRVKESAIGGKLEQGKNAAGILLIGDLAKVHQALAIGDLVIGKAPAVPLSFGAYLPVLGGMLLGGLILNLMPCVFPVLGLKIMGFVQQSGQDRKKIAAHGFAFTAGVLISFWVLCGILLVVRARSSSGDIGWGYQLQEKWFVYGLVMLFFIFGLSMFGLFEIGVSATSVGGKLQAKSGLLGSFFSGVLATVAATPCSAPILGPAIGAAIALPTVQFFVAFTAMALGLSLPYLLFSIFPKLVGFLPRPGAWMESFKQAMAFLLLGAAAYFFWVYLDHVAEDVHLLVFFGMVALGVAAWIYGRWATPYKALRTKMIARVLAVVFAGSGFYMAWGPYHGLEWQSWSQAKVDKYLEEDTPVYVDFTAKWCATCQVNKKVAYTPEVVNLFKERGIVPLRADKTKPDPAIEEKIEEFHKAAIPVNVLYVPGKEPIITPEILTPSYMKELIEREVPKKEKTADSKGTAQR